jgi:hypothetical protein
LTLPRRTGVASTSCAREKCVSSSGEPCASSYSDWRVEVWADRELLAWSVALLTVFCECMNCELWIITIKERVQFIR